MKDWLQALKDSLLRMKDGLFPAFHRYRFLANPTSRQKEVLKNLLDIQEDEEVEFVIDDSPLRNLKNVLVFTNRRMYWNLKPLAKILQGGRNLVETASLLSSMPSPFVASIKGCQVVFVVSDALQLLIPFRNIGRDEPLYITFWDYFAKHCKDYRPDEKHNGDIFRKQVKAYKHSSPPVFAFLNALILVPMLVVSILTPDVLFLPPFSPIIEHINDLLFCSMVLSLLNTIVRKGKSLLSNSLLIISVVLLPGFNPIGDRSIYILYAVLSMLFNFVNFDKVSKYAVVTGAVAAMVFFFLRSFGG